MPGDLVSAEIVQLVEQAGPYPTTAVGAYGVAVFSQAEGAAVDATASGERSIAAKTIAAAVTGDDTTIRP